MKKDQVRIAKALRTAIHTAIKFSLIQASVKHQVNKLLTLKVKENPQSKVKMENPQAIVAE